MKKIISMLFVPVVLLCGCGNSSNIESNLYEPEIISFKLFSETIKDTFVVDVSLPENYKKNSIAEYPVLYLTDGNWRRQQHRQIHRMSKTENVKELIVVGISYPDNYNFDKIRVRDLINRPDQFLDFILEKVIPFVENKYRGSGERTLWGSSFGGFFALYTLFNYDTKTKNVFQNYIVASPAAMEKGYYNGEYINLFEIENKKFEKSPELKANLYMAVGDIEDRDRFYNPFKNLVDLFNNRKYNGFYFKFFIDPGKDHYTVWEPALYKGIKIFLNK